VYSDAGELCDNNAAAAADAADCCCCWWCRVRGVETMEELQDVYQHFLLYYSQDLGKMKAAVKAARKKQRELRRLERETSDGVADDNDADDEDDEPADSTLKHATRKSGYTMCIEAGLG